MTLAGLLLALALAAAAGVAAWITRSISRPVRDLERGMDAVAGGKFDHRLAIAPGRTDEFGRLAASFQSMAGQLAAASPADLEPLTIGLCARRADLHRPLVAALWDLRP